MDAAGSFRIGECLSTCRPEGTFRSEIWRSWNNFYSTGVSSALRSSGEGRLGSDSLSRISASSAETPDASPAPEFLSSRPVSSGRHATPLQLPSSSIFVRTRLEERLMKRRLRPLLGAWQWHVLAEACLRARRGDAGLLAHFGVFNGPQLRGMSLHVMFASHIGITSLRVSHRSQALVLQSFGSWLRSTARVRRCRQMEAAKV